MVAFWWGLVSWFIAGAFSMSPHMVEGAGDLCGTPFIRTLIPFVRAPPSWPNHPQRPHLLIPSPWGLGFQHMNFGGRETSRPQQQWLIFFLHFSFAFFPWGTTKQGQRRYQEWENASYDLKLEVRVVHRYECTKCHGIVHFKKKKVHFVLCGFHPNKNKEKRRH